MKKFVKNWSYLVLSDVITKAFGFFATILLARNLSPAGYGNYNVILAVSAIFTVVANFGMTQVITREIARRTEISGNLFFRALAIRFVSSFLAILGIIGYFLILEPQVDRMIILFTCIITISITAWDLAESIAFGRQIMKYSAVINSFASFVWIVVLFILPKNYFTILNVILIFSIIDVLKALVYFVILRKQNFLIKVETEFLPNYKNIITMSLPYLWLWGMGIFSNQIPVLFLSQNTNAEEVGYYSIGLRLLIPITLVTSTAMKAVFPNLSKLYKENSERFQKIISDGSILILFFGSIVAAILTLFSKYFIPFLFGETYYNAIMPFNFLIWYMIIYSLDVLIGTALSASDRQFTLALLGTIDFLIAIPILYYGSIKGAYFLAMAKLIIGGILVTYHWIVIKNIIGKYFNILSWLIIISYMLFLIYFSFSNYHFSDFLKFLIIGMLTVIYLFYRRSPFNVILNIIKEGL